ncbi:probable tocopherol O-methyltransferase, chloroplastic isoform X3 [Coffea eugenioides]|uniref:probable tocopherol O-methyltransferase, chloroplastic isoform X3 n=1 Tax=Coffea eugenioides TaxID=49369 RepID=UPI000F607834|nr:probable tocopherol O-methyltransferase, chloroplastic isoform X3 [Coffea eugenioides]
MEGEKMDTEGKVETEKMNKAIAMAYDVQSKILEDITGDHLHTGFYDSSSVIPGSDVNSAQTRMIEAALRFASVSEDPSKKPRNILDVGCGIGGSTRYLASKYGAQAKGITLSPVEAERARVLTAAQGLESQQVSFEVADALNQPFADGSFDLIWCIECENHISDKTKFVHELNRVAAPGATIILLTWCHRDLSPLENDLHPDEKKLLTQTGSRSRVKWISTADYINLFQSCSFQIKYADWSPHVAPYYAELRKITLSWKGIMSYVRHAGWRQMSIKFLMMPSVFDTFKNGLLKYCILTCQKPQ